MARDEEQIRDLIETWMAATQAGDIQSVLDLMTDDVVFMVAGQEPFGKEAFRKTAAAMEREASSVRYEGTSTIEELEVTGDVAYARTRLEIATIPTDGSQQTRRSGYTLSVFRKENGAWKLARDANLLTVSE